MKKYTSLFKLIILIFLIVTLLFIIFNFSKDIFIKNKSNMKIAIIDTDKVMNESFIIKDIQVKMKEQSFRIQEELKSELEKFKPSKEEFELLSEEARKERTEQFSY